MSRPASPGAREEDPEPDASVEVAAAESAMAGLLSLLRRLGPTLNPVLRKQLRELGEELSALLEDPDSKPGRHRSPAGHDSGLAAGQPGDDASRPVSKPDPGTVRTAAELVAALRQYRDWSPKASLRKIAARSGQLATHSTIYRAMRPATMPALPAVQAIIIGCGGSQDDIDGFTAAWHRLNPSAGPTREEPGPLPAPVGPASTSPVATF